MVDVNADVAVAIFAAIVIAAAVAAAAAPADMCPLWAIADGLAACKACRDVAFRSGNFGTLE